MTLEFTRLLAQVRKAHSGHYKDEESNLRSRIGGGKGKALFLGDVAEGLLRCMPAHSVPKVIEGPGFDEQKWVIIVETGTLDVRITSNHHRWFGMFTTCYHNIIEIDGPVEERTRLIFDLNAILQHNPWELKPGRGLKNWNLKENLRSWADHLDYASSQMKTRIDTLEDRLKELGIEEQDVDIARSALHDDNLPAVERSLSRIEARIIAATEEEEGDWQSPEGSSMPEIEGIEVVDLSEEEE